MPQMCSIFYGRCEDCGVVRLADNLCTVEVLTLKKKKKRKHAIALSQYRMEKKKSTANFSMCSFMLGGL